MNVARVLSPLVWKELREIGPVWLMGLSLVTVLALVPGRGPDPINLAIFALVAVALGAMSMGHEYRHRTLSMLLAQPEARAHLAAVKAVVLLVLLTVLASIVWVDGSVVPAPGQVGRSFRILIPVACAICLAPWFTMMTRSELAGMVFACAVPAVLWLTGQAVGIAVHGLSLDAAGEAARLRSLVFVVSLAVVCAVGALGSVRAFLRLQDLDGPAASITERRWRYAAVGSRVDTSRRQSPYWSLVKKELRLQHLSFVVALLFALAWVGLVTADRSIGAVVDTDTLHGLLLVIYVGSVTLLVGAVSSAEERQMGTLATQMLQPLAMRTQWIVKVATALAVLVMLAAIVPVVLAAAWPGDGSNLRLGFPRGANYLRSRLGETGAVLFAFALSVYVSTLNTGGLKAFLVSVAALTGVATLGSVLLVNMAHVANGYLQQLMAVPGISQFALDSSTADILWRWAPLATATILTVAYLTLGSANHRRIDLGWRDIRRQLSWIVGLLVVAVMAQMAILMFFHAAWVARMTELRK